MGDPIRFNIDEPGPAARLRCGTINFFAGWVLHDTDPVTAVAFSVNGSQLGALPVNHDRPDLMKPFGKIRLGFWGPVLIPEQYFGSTLRVEAVTRGGIRFFMNDFALNDIVSAEEREFKRQHNLPDDLLMRLVVSDIDPKLFLRRGKESVELIRRILQNNGIDILSFSNILDFGVGCGRVMRWWEEYSDRIVFWGTDINEQLIAWCAENLRFARSSLNALHPPTQYDGEAFDLLYAFSIFTHLTLSTQSEWLKEFARILVPGRYAIISVHGDADAQSLPAEQREQYLSEGHLTRSDNVEGENMCAVFQNRAVSERLFSPWFDVVEFLPAARSSTSSQDVYLLRKR